MLVDCGCSLTIRCFFVLLVIVACARLRVPLGCLFGFGGLFVECLVTFCLGNVVSWLFVSDLL